MSFKLGILIIGSLFWRRQPYRVLWRKERLKESETIPVNAPIRYGRLSLSKTYTMVFAPGCPLGTAKVVPCVKEVTSLRGVYDEAKELWIAECIDGTELTDSARISASWGCVALLPNSASQIPESFLNEWAECVGYERDEKGRPTYSESEFAIDGQSSISDRGILQIPWPARADTSMPLSGIDLLLATATRPRFARGAKQFPSEHSIAEAWCVNGKEVEYFRSNRDNGIHTFQDNTIEQLLSNSS